MKKRWGSYLLSLLLFSSLLFGGCVLSLPRPNIDAAGADSVAPAVTAHLNLLEEGNEASDAPADGASLPTETAGETQAPPDTPAPQQTAAAPSLDRDGAYTSKEDVALYLSLYGCLPGNFITKKEARDLGWSGGGLDDYAYGMCIGGDRFGNYEGLLPERSGRNYYECDIGTLHKSSRGAKRIIFSSDGLIYYTGDHYESFTLLYGEE